MAFLCCMFSSRPVWAQASVNVSTLDPVYRDIDKLVANGLVDKIVMGQKPFSRKEIARIIAEAAYHLPRLGDQLQDPALSEKQKDKIQDRMDYVNGILRRLKADYREELVESGALRGEKSWYSIHAVDKVVVDTTLTNSAPLVLNDDNGLGRVNAVINPLLDYRQGRNLVDGANLSLETSHWLRASNYFALYVQPRFQLGLGSGLQPNVNEAFIENLYGKLNFKNVEVEIGRDNLVYGQGQNAGILLSNNPRGLDMAKISNDSPFFLPWYFKYLGALKLSFFYSDLGPEQFFPHSYLTGYKFSLQPISFAEIGFSLLVDSGGEGSPSGSFGRRVATVFAFNPESDTQGDFSNKIGGVDFRFRIPPARGMELYLEAMFDDHHHSIFSTAQLVDDASYVGGFYFPRLNNTGSLDLRLEYHFTGPRFYRHSTWLSGWTLNKFLLGDDLGPNAQGAYVTANWDLNGHHLLTFNGAFEDRSDDLWTVDDPVQFNFKKVLDRPNEYRGRITAEWFHRIEDLPMNLRVQVGYERVHNFQFMQDNDRNNFLARGALEISLDRWTHFPQH